MQYNLAFDFDLSGYRFSNRSYLAVPNREQDRIGTNTTQIFEFEYLCRDPVCMLTKAMI